MIVGGDEGASDIRKALDVRPQSQRLRRVSDDAEREGVYNAVEWSLPRLVGRSPHSEIVHTFSRT